MRLFVGLLTLLAAVGCTGAIDGSGNKYLFKTNAERCADIAAKDSPEYADCREKLAFEDAQRIYNLNRNGSKPGWVVLRSIY